jgi:prophage antirepressor-like protein
MEENYLIPHVFIRHKLHLHALLIENQPWFSARDLGRLLRLFPTPAGRERISHSTSLL